MYVYKPVELEQNSSLYLFSLKQFHKAIVYLWFALGVLLKKKNGSRLPEDEIKAT